MTNVSRAVSTRSSILVYQPCSMRVEPRGLEPLTPTLPEAISGPSGNGTLTRANVHLPKRLALSPWMTACPPVCLRDRARLGTAFRTGCSPRQ